MKSIAIIGVLILFLVGCSTHKFKCKSWHKSPSYGVYTSTFFESVDWSVIKQLHIGMNTAEVEKRIHILSINNSGVGLVYSTLKGSDYEIAVQFADDRQSIVDISYKEVELSTEAKRTIVHDVRMENEPGITREEFRKLHTISE